ncbi:transposase, IS605 OrfB family [Halothece sp. PCC 7418]|uniref:RNA-guided endonuclease InsQ/TnpB family protein n=1 Tax=Halothece sp. (strain PCC 7418) TaxID=65093 RepID=UPI0002A068A9|nr:RNA-guided endonuclease TnpB family protein [Halothece sp. PCC 7418]AFZ43045.1 transposase, IS605 OrfB family [Halothece sp. PCC 7418]
MRQVQKHLIKKTHRKFKEIDEASFASKNLFNSAVYICRQAFFSNQPVPSYNQLDHKLKAGKDYKALPSKVAQLVIKQVIRCFDSYFEAIKAYNIDPSKFFSKPKLPKYKKKIDGRNVLTYNCQAFSRKWLQKGYLKPSGLSLKVPTNLRKVEEVRIIPKGNCYAVEAIYTVDILPEQQCQGKIASIDIGLDNLATVASNDFDFKPFIVDGKAIKSCNQYYNKRRAKLQSLLTENQFTSNQIEGLTQKRNNKMDYYLHTASRFIIDKLLERGVTHLIIGKNENWKQSIGIGKRNNQNFTQVPHARLIDQLTYKAKLVGIKVTITEESYTSKCSFLDLEPIKKHSSYKGRRVKRGLFKSSLGKKINADLNGALNIMRKVVGDSVFDGKPIERLVVSPVRFKPYKA